MGSVQTLRWVSALSPSLGERCLCIPLGPQKGLPFSEVMIGDNYLSFRNKLIYLFCAERYSLGIFLTHGKSFKHASIAFWEYFIHFWINKNVLAVLPISGHKSPILIHNQFIFLDIQFLGKNGNLSNIYMIRKYVNLWVFFNPENRLTDKNQLFSCLIFYEPHQKHLGEYVY